MGIPFLLHIATPDKQFYHSNIESLVLTTTDGEMGVLAYHTPMVAVLVPAPLRMLPEGETEWKEAAVTGGFARITHGEVMIFADTAEWPEDIEESRALRAKQRAEERLQDKTNEVEYLHSRVALERAVARLNVKRHSINR